MTRRSPSTSAESDDSPANRLQAAVEELAGNVRVLTDVVDQIREDLTWLTRNGLPHQPLVVHVHRMPLVSVGEGNGRSFEFSLLSLPEHDPTSEALSDDQLRDAVIDQVVDRLAEPLGQLAQEQLNTLLSVLDDAQRELLKAIRHPRAVSPAQETASEQPSLTKPRRRKTKQGESASVAPPTPIPSAASKAPITAAEPAVPTQPPPPPGQLF